MFIFLYVFDVQPGDDLSATSLSHFDVLLEKPCETSRHYVTMLVYVLFMWWPEYTYQPTSWSLFKLA